RYCEVARRLDAARDADLVTVDAGSDAPMHVVREDVSLDVDEQQWRADNAVGLAVSYSQHWVPAAERRGSGRSALRVAQESQAEFDARREQGRVERMTRVVDPAAFARIPQVDDVAF